MSILNWFAPKKAVKAGAASSTAGLSRLETTKHANASKVGASANQATSASAASHKHERVAQREHLYAVVRESMTSAGVLSPCYKFKVLSLDSRGRRFLVMIDLAPSASAQTVQVAQLADIETAIAHAANGQHDISVVAVYWRSNEHIAAIEQRPHAAPHSPSITQRSAHADAVSQPAARTAGASDQAHTEPQRPVAMPALRDAKAQGANATAFAGLAKHGPQSYTLLTGFEDTEMPDEEEARADDGLSATQFGELR